MGSLRAHEIFIGLIYKWISPGYGPVVNGVLGQRASIPDLALNVFNVCKFTYSFHQLLEGFLVAFRFSGPFTYV